MSSRHRIDQALTSVPMGDVEKYFAHISNIIETNSGTNDCKMISHDCNNTAVPVHGGQFTRFKLTDQAMDIVDISKGYIMMKLEMDVNFDVDTTAMGAAQDPETYKPVYFIGFKSGSHIVEIYNVYSNGVLTACKQTKARHEQAITYSSKAKEERVGRPGMYTTHEKVREMSDCVCGAYISAPEYAKRNESIPITFDIVVQVDDLLPFSAFEYFPRFMVGDLELELSASLYQNMVWCPVPQSYVQVNTNLPTTYSPNTYSAIMSTEKLSDLRFTQCGDYADTISPYRRVSGGDESVMIEHTKMTIKPSNLVITEAKSYIHGFNIKQEAKANITAMFGDKNLVIPAQWIDHYTFSQLPTTNSIRTNIQTALFNACQAIITFPNSANQLTVSRNPHLESIQCQISDRIIPDKFFSTLDKAHAEMIIANLNMDSLFTAPDELIESLTKDRTDGWTLKRVDDSDYMLVFNLERFGNGCFCDGITERVVPINFQANFMHGTQNPHYYDGSKLLQHNLNLFIVSDAFWVCNSQGCQFIKDVATKF